MNSPNLQSILIYGVASFAAAFLINEMYRRLRAWNDPPSQEPLDDADVPTASSISQVRTTLPSSRSEPPNPRAGVRRSMTPHVSASSHSIDADVTVDLPTASTVPLPKAIDYPVAPDTAVTQPQHHDLSDKQAANAMQSESKRTPSLATRRITQTQPKPLIEERVDSRRTELVNPLDEHLRRQSETVAELLREDTSNIMIQTASARDVAKRLKPILTKLHGQVLFCSANEQCALRNGMASLFDMFRLSHDPLNVERSASKGLALNIATKDLSWLVITDAQLLDPATASALSYRLQRLLSNDIPFGGVRVILLGDFLAPSRSLDADVVTEFMQRFGSLRCVASPLLQQHPLQTVIIQHTTNRKSPRLLNTLDRIVRGASSIADLHAIATKPSNATYVTIVSTPADAIYINDAEVEKIGARRTVYSCERSAYVTPDMLPCPERLSVCIGSRVVLLEDATDASWRRGDTGTVTSLRADRIYVQLDNGTKVSVPKHTWQAPIHHKAGANVQADQLYHTITQFPLALGWAVDVHNTLGMTIPSVHIHDILHKQGNASLLYAAISAAADIGSISSSISITPDMVRAETLIASAFAHGT